MTPLELLDAPTSSLTRRRFVVGAAGSVLAAAFLAACGSEDDAEAEPESDGSYPRDITHAMGTSTIPTRPSRAVAVSDFNDLDYLLALGVKAVLYGFSDAWSSGAMPWQGGAKDLESFDATVVDPDVEAIAAAKPDLIVAMQADEELYDRLSQIAPTVILAWDMPWRDGLRLIGAAFGLEAKAEARIRDGEKLLANAKTELASIADKQLMVGFQYDTTFYVWGDETAPALVFKELGLNFVGGPEPGLTEASLEQVRLLDDADILLSVASDPDGIKTQEASALFKRIPAVAAGGYDVITVVQSRAIADGVSPLSLAWVLPELVSLLRTLANGGASGWPRPRTATSSPHNARRE